MSSNAFYNGFSLIILIPLAIIGFLTRYKLWSSLPSELFSIGTHELNRQLSKLPPPAPKTLDDYYSAWHRLRAGCFKGGILQRMNTDGTGSVSLAELVVLTIFHVSIPDSQELNFKIKLDHRNLDKAMNAASPAEFVEAIDWDVPDREVADRFGHRDSLTEMKRLMMAVGPFEICCEGTQFIIVALKKIETVEALEGFHDRSLELFRFFAQVAQLRLPTWRIPGEGSYDWWSKSLAEEKEEKINTSN